MAKSIMSRMKLGDKLIQAICPEGWAEYIATRPRGRRMSNAVGFRFVDAIDSAGRIMDMLHAEGYPVPAKKSQKRPSKSRP